MLPLGWLTCSGEEASRLSGWLAGCLGAMEGRAWRGRLDGAMGCGICDSCDVLSGERLSAMGFKAPCRGLNRCWLLLLLAGMA